MHKMSEVENSARNTSIEIKFDPILPDSGVLFYEECPAEYEIERPKLMPLKSTTQIRFEELQQQATRQWTEKKKTAKSANKS